MNRLSTYLLKLFAAEATGLFGVALTIIYLAQTLRIIDIDTVRERGLGVLFWQTILAVPQLAIAFLYTCIAIGLARALRGMQASRELHTIHVSQLVPSLFRAVLIYAGLGMVLVLLLSHVIEPAAKRATNMLQAQAAADLVGRSLVPNRFAELGEGVTVTVGGRGPRGEITSFFADDNRDPNTRRTYIADSALISSDELGYVLQLEKGTIQYRTADGQFSEISFDRYDIALERLTGEVDDEKRRRDLGTLAMVNEAIAEGEWPEEWVNRIAERSADGLRVVALCLFVVAIGGFPSGRRRDPLVPIELTVLAAVLVERAMTSYVPIGGWQQHFMGVLVLLVIALVILSARLRLFLPQPRGAHSG
ncbi:LptF/LptG family permease [Devosia sp. CN2-171]|uniref:LptF/LptG family permease n=1 Tax=Devosia sp. CN2-171 TaxID=3400909 RepID=UPI003BF86828